MYVMVMGRTLMNIAKTYLLYVPQGKSVDDFVCNILIFGKEIGPGRHYVLNPEVIQS